MDLRDFPFDVQDLPVNISSSWLASDMNYVFVNEDSDSAQLIEICTDPIVKDNGEYALTGVNVETLEHHYANLARYDFQQEGYHEISVKFQFARNPVYYLRGLFLIINMVLLIACASFWLDPTDTGTRFSISTTMFLTLVAFHFVILGQLPKVPYLTRLDKWIVGCYVLMFYSNIENILMFQLSTTLPDMCTQWCPVIDRSLFGFFLLVQLGNGAWFLLPYFSRKKGFKKFASMRNRVIELN